MTLRLPRELLADFDARELTDKTVTPMLDSLKAQISAALSPTQERQQEPTGVGPSAPVQRGPAVQAPTEPISFEMPPIDTFIGSSLTNAGGAGTPDVSNAPEPSLGVTPSPDDGVDASPVSFKLPPVSIFTGEQPQSALTTLGGTPEAESLTQPGGTAYVNPGASGGTSSAPQDIEGYIRYAAQKRGIDPNVAVRVAQSEGGLSDPVRQSDYVNPRTGKREESYGPFQLYMGGGLGNAFQAATGKAPSDPSAWRQGVDFALDQAARGGWGPWYGAARVGIGNRQGLEDARPAGIEQDVLASAGQPVSSGQRSATPLPAPGDSTSADFQRIAEQWKGVPYVFGGAGGRSTQGVAPTDCSGFVAELTGLPAHTDAAYRTLEQRGAVKVDESQAKPGDVVFYMGAGTGGAVTHHMGLYAGPGKVLDMSTASGGGVQVRPIGHAGRFEILRDPQDQSTPAPPPNAAPPTPIVEAGVAEQTGGEKPQQSEIEMWSQLGQTLGGQRVKGMPIADAMSTYGGMAMEDLSGAGGTASGESAVPAPPVRDVRGDYAPRAVEPGDYQLETARPLAAATSDAVEPAPTQAPASLGDQIKSAFSSFGETIGNLLSPPRESVAQAGADIRERQATVPGSPQAAALAQEPLPLEQFGRELGQAAQQPSPSQNIYQTVTGPVRALGEAGYATGDRLDELSRKDRMFGGPGLTPDEEAEYARLFINQYADIGGVTALKPVPGVIGQAAKPILEEAARRGVPDAAEALASLAGTGARAAGLAAGIVDNSVSGTPGGLNATAGTPGGFISSAQASDIPIPPRAGAQEIDRLRAVPLDDGSGRWTVADGRGDYANEIRGNPVAFPTREAAEQAVGRYEQEFRDFSSPMPTGAGSIATGVGRGAVQGAVAGGYEASQEPGADIGTVARGAALGAAEGAVLGGARRLVGPRGAGMVARAVQEAPQQNQPKTGAEAWDAVTETFKPGAPEPPAFAQAARKFKDTVQQNLFDSTAPMRERTEAYARAIGRKLTPEENAWLQVRLLPGVDRATKQEVAERFGPIVKGLDDTALEQLNGRLAALDAIDKAKSVGQRVETATYRAGVTSEVPLAGEAALKSPALKNAETGLERAQAQAATIMKRAESNPVISEEELNAAKAQADLVVSNATQTRDRAVSAMQKAQSVHAQAQAQREADVMARAMQKGQTIVERRKFGEFTAPEARAALDYLDSKLSPFEKADLEKRSQLVQDHVAGLRQRLVNSGLLSKEVADAWATKNPNYTPIRFTDWMDAAEKRTGGPTSLSVSDNGVQGLSDFGASYKRQTPLEALHDVTYEVERRAAKNEAAATFMNYAKSDPVFRDLVRPANGEAATFLGQDIASKARPTETTFSMWQNGQKHEFYIDKAIDNAFRQDAYKIDLPGMQAITATNYAFRQGTTGLNALFLIPNALGDGYTAMIRGESLGTLAHGYKQSFTHGPEYQAFMKAGGGYSGLMERGNALTTINELRGREVLGTLDQIKAYAKWANPLEYVRELGERVEMGPRVGAFSQALSKGAPVEEAALAGRDITMDFARAGLWTRAVNRFVPFFNVGMQAPAQVARFLSKTAEGEIRPNQAQAIGRIAGMVVAPVVSLEIYNRTHPTYADVPQYDKDRGMVIMDPRGPGEVDPDTGRPTPRYTVFAMREWTPFAIATREAFRTAVGDDMRAPTVREHWEKLADALLTYSSPISLSEGPASFLPPVVQIPWEMKANYDSFRQRQIIPDSVADRLPEEQYTSTTSETSKLIGRAIKKPPAMIDYAVRGFFGGVGSQALAVGDIALRAAGAAPPAEDRGRVRDIPVVGGVAQRFYREQGGALTERARTQNAAEFERIMRDNGLRGDEISRPGWTIGDTRLNAAEKAQYDALFNDYLETEIGFAMRGSGNPSDQAKKAAEKARQKASREVLRSIPSYERTNRQVEAARAR